ncbi:MAG: LLM class flavin-dependent oxidoreductase [Betaproteobacteria bacterium]
MKSIPLSVLDLAPIVEGGDAADALRRSLDLARHAEKLGYRRYWVAEHHNMQGIASAATSVVIGYLANGTSTIRVGAGGIMLPNHAPLVIAEQFGTLQALYPGRIDLGLGRAPGTDQLTARALRGDWSDPNAFPNDVLELQAFLGPVQEGQRVIAVPGAGSNVPIWILGSSLFGAQLAAMLGLPYAFASHFAPQALLHALEVYRKTFKPSPQQATPYAMAGVNVVAAQTDAQARRLFTSVQMRFTDMVRNRRGKLQPPIDDIDTYWQPHERMHAEGMLKYAFVGSPQTVKTQLDAFVDETQLDEVMVTSMLYDHEARKRSYALLAET